MFAAVWNERDFGSKPTMLAGEFGGHAERVLTRAADFPFGDKGPVVLAGTVVEQALESGADGGFAGDAEVVKLAQGRIVILDRLVRWLQFQPLHGGVLHQCRGGRQGES